MTLLDCIKMIKTDRNILVGNTGFSLEEIEGKFLTFEVDEIIIRNFACIKLVLKKKHEEMLIGYTSRYNARKVSCEEIFFDGKVYRPNEYYRAIDFNTREEYKYD